MILSLSGPVSLVGSPVQVVAKLCPSRRGLWWAAGETTPFHQGVWLLWGARSCKLGTAVPIYTTGTVIQQRIFTCPLNLEEFNKKALKTEKGEALQNNMSGPTSHPTLRRNLGRGWICWITCLEWSRAVRAKPGVIYIMGTLWNVQSHPVFVILNSHSLPHEMQPDCKSGTLETVCLHWGND